MAEHVLSNPRISIEAYTQTGRSLIDTKIRRPRQDSGHSNAPHHLDLIKIEYYLWIME
jgi:hypothetical protein